MEMPQLLIRGNQSFSIRCSPWVQNNTVERNNQINELTEQSENLEADVAIAKKS